MLKINRKSCIITKITNKYQMSEFQQLNTSIYLYLTPRDE